MRSKFTQWQVQQTLPLAQGPGLLPNNLSASSGNSSMVYAERSNVHVAPGPRSQAPRKTVVATRDRSVVIQVKMCSIGHNEFLVIATSLGVQVWDAPGMRLMGTVNHSDWARTDSTVGLYCRGIGSDAGSSLLYVGTSNGSVLRIHFDAINGCDTETVLESDKSAVVDVSCSSTTVVSGHDDGSILLWEQGVSKPVHTFNAGSPILTVIMRADVIIAGTANGELVFCRKSAKYLQHRIVAHARSLTALDIHPSEPFLASVGEDGCLNVWELSTKRDEKPTLKQSQHLPDQMLTGVQFSRNGDLSLTVSAYDHSTLTVFLG